MNISQTMEKCIFFTFNCRTLSKDYMLEELLTELGDIQWHLVGLGEVRRSGEGCLELNDGHVFYYRGEGSVYGIGFLVNKVIKTWIVKFKSYSDRICKLILKPDTLKGGGRIVVIQVYAPTSQASEIDTEYFYDMLKQAIDEDQGRFKLIMGDFNAKIGKKSGETYVGNHCVGERNETGERFLEFTEGMKLHVMNTYYDKPFEKKWTWITPDGKHKNEIDFVLCNRKELINDVEAGPFINTGSDHRPVKSVINLNVGKRKRNEKQIQRLSTQEFRALNFEDEISKELLLANLDYNENIEKTETLTNIIKKVSKDVSTSKTQHRNTKQMPKKIRRLLEKRRKIKRTSSSNIAFRNISKTIRKSIKDWSKEKKIEELNKAIMEGGSVKKCTQKMNIGKQIMSGIKNKQGVLVDEKKNIPHVIAEYYQDLYTDPTREIDKNASHKEKGEHHEVSEEILEILESEVRFAIEKLKERKAGGIDEVVNEELKAGGTTMVKELRLLFNACLNTKKTPKSWLKAILIILFKKGDKHDLKNYRPLSMLCGLYKVYMDIITRRIDHQLESEQQVEQTGFRRNFSTNDNIFTLKQLIHQSEVYNFSLFLLFLDFEKAYDSVKTSAILTALKEAGVSKSYRDIVEYIYEGSELIVRMNGEECCVKLERGLKQGDVASSKLFNAVLQMVFRKLDWRKYGININGKHLNELRFADDIVLIGQSAEELGIMLDQLIQETKKVGLRLNAKKCKVMKINTGEMRMDLKIDNETIEEVKDMIYLGHRLASTGQEKEISRRISIAWNTFNKYGYLFRSGVNMEEKKKLWNMCVLPSLVYACETWTLDSKTINRMRVTVRSMERAMTGISKRERKRNEYISSITGLTDIGKTIALRKWKWVGHMIRCKDDRWTTRMMNWCPMDRKRKVGRPKTRWDEEMRKICGEATWRRVVWERNEWKRMGNVLANVWLVSN